MASFTLLARGAESSTINLLLPGWLGLSPIGLQWHRLVRLSGIGPMSWCAASIWASMTSLSWEYGVFGSNGTWFQVQYPEP